MILCCWSRQDVKVGDWLCDRVRGWRKVPARILSSISATVNSAQVLPLIADSQSLPVARGRWRHHWSCLVSLSMTPSRLGEAKMSSTSRLEEAKMSAWPQRRLHLHFCVVDAAATAILSLISLLGWSGSRFRPISVFLFPLLFLYLLRVLQRILFRCVSLLPQIVSSWYFHWAVCTVVALFLCGTSVNCRLMVFHLGLRLLVHSFYLTFQFRG